MNIRRVAITVIALQLALKARPTPPKPQEPSTPADLEKNQPTVKNNIFLRLAEPERSGPNEAIRQLANMR